MLYRRDKGMFFSSLCSPLILIFLYTTFLANVYKDSFYSSLPSGFAVSDRLINGTVAAQLTSALLAVSCVTVTFCVNLIMVSDHATGSRKDFDISPVRKPMLYFGYLIATVVNSLMVNLVSLGACLAYSYRMGWYLSATDLLYLVLDMLVLVLFGALLSGIICYPMRTQGQMSAIGTVISAGYGFLCGAYMPISTFGEGLQKVLSFLPSTYGTALIKKHSLRGVFEAMETEGMPEEVVEAIAEVLDCRPDLLGHTVNSLEMYGILLGTIAVLAMLYYLLSKERK